MHLRTEWTISSHTPVFNDVSRLVGEWSETWAHKEVGASVTGNNSYWHGEHEYGATIRFDWPSGDVSGPGLRLALERLLAYAMIDVNLVHRTQYHVDFDEINLHDVSEALVDHVCEPECDARVPGHPDCSDDHDVFARTCEKCRIDPRPFDDHAQGKGTPEWA